ncbi:MAG: hypothetical protein QOD06_425, partial [Candidatus Binatota bacterium]|nr:hypothetical protein [Candidatus Binatota bacterium]
MRLPIRAPLPMLAGRSWAPRPTLAYLSRRGAASPAAISRAAGAVSVRGQRVDVVVVGGGPAGAIVARGLALLGHEVAVVSAPRPFAAVEGVSERAAAVLRRIGARHALAALGGPIPRTSTWGGRSSRANVEHLVDRDAFDRRLRQDACDAGARGVEGRVVRCLREGNGWRVTVATSERKSATLQARFLVEARGRSAPVDPTARRGPLGVALVAEWRLAKRKRRQTAIASFRHGWAWLVVAGHGRAYLQVVVSGAARRLPSRGALGRFYVALVRQIPEAARWLEGAEMAGNVRARASTAALSGEIAADDFVRVGDAAFAVDPLSGSGIYEAIAGALGAVPVVNTLIHRPAQGLIARRFHRERVEDAFLRMAR